MPPRYCVESCPRVFCGLNFLFIADTQLIHEFPLRRKPDAEPQKSFFFCAFFFFYLFCFVRPVHWGTTGPWFKRWRLPNRVVDRQHRWFPLIRTPRILQFSISGGRAGAAGRPPTQRSRNAAGRWCWFRARRFFCVWPLSRQQPGPRKRPARIRFLQGSRRLPSATKKPCRAQRGLVLGDGKGGTGSPYRWSEEATPKARKWA